jgi:hypothetical protein
MVFQELWIPTNSALRQNLEDMPTDSDVQKEAKKLVERYKAALPSSVRERYSEGTVVATVRFYILPIGSDTKHLF